MNLLFITLVKFRKKPTKEMLAEVQRFRNWVNEQGGKILGSYWTLGRYDMVTISDCPDEKSHMKAMLKIADLVSTETLAAVTAEEAGKLVE